MISILSQVSSDNISENLTSAFPYLGTFTVVIVLVKIIVSRSGNSETLAAKSLKDAEERLFTQVAAAIKESEEKCNARLEAAEADCAAKVYSVETTLNIIKRGMDIIAEEYPDNKTLQFLLSTLNKE